MTDTFIAMSSIRSTYFSGLCDKIQKGNASELEVIDAIKDLCNDNERLAVLSRRKAAEIANARTPVSVQEAAKVLLESLGDYDNDRSHPAFEAASQAYYASNKPAPFNVIDDALIGALRAIAEGEKP